MDCSTCTNRCESMLSRQDLERSGVDQANIRKMRLAKHMTRPAMPFDAEVLLDCEDKRLRPGEAFIIDIGGALRFAFAALLPSGGMNLQAAYDLTHSEMVDACAAGKALVIGRAFRVDWLTG